MPNSAFYVNFTNGRNFANVEFADKIAKINHPILIGIPFFSDVGSIHDYVVQANGVPDSV